MKQNNYFFNSDDKKEIDKLDKRKIGSVISENRKAKGFTQSELAEKLNISFQAVSNWECGNTLPDLSNILELSKLFGISIDALLCNEPSDNGNEHVQGDDTLSKYDIDALELLNATTDSDTSKIGNMVRLMPFVSKDTINKIIVELSRKNVPANKLAVLAPFADSSAVDKAIEYKLCQGQAPNDVYPLSIFASTKKYIPYYHADINVDVNIDKDSIKSEDHIDSNKQKKQMTELDRIITLSELLDGDVPEDIIYDWLECHRTVGHIIEIYSLDIPCVCDYVQDFVLDNSEYYSVDDLIELYDNGIIDDMLEIVSDKKLSIDDLHKLKCYLDDDEIVELSDNNI